MSIMPAGRDRPASSRSMAAAVAGRLELGHERHAAGVGKGHQLHEFLQVPDLAAVAVVDRAVGLARLGSTSRGT